MIPLVYELWKVIICNPSSDEDKINNLCAVLHCYSALLGMTNKDFTALTKIINDSYPGPYPDGISEQIISFYENAYDK